MAPPPRLLALLCLAPLAAGAEAPRCSVGGATPTGISDAECAAEDDELGLGQLRAARVQPHAGVTLGSGTRRRRLSSAYDGIRALQWNPHWQCFVQSPTTCSPKAQKALTEVLTSGLDFANVVELEPDPPYDPPAHWKELTQQCGYDVTTLFYNSANWSLVGKSHPGCMDGNDRPFVVQAFASKSSGMKVVVVGAHFPHGSNWGSLSSAIAAATSKAGTSNVVFMADTNTDAQSADIFSRLGVAGKAHGTDLLPTCCNTNSPGYIFHFDRVIANFGDGMATEELFSPLPSWASQANNEFHSAVVGTLSV